jgi:hypothetical protein
MWLSGIDGGVRRGSVDRDASVRQGGPSDAPISGSARGQYSGWVLWRVACWSSGLRTPLRSATGAQTAASGPRLRTWVLDHGSLGVLVPGELLDGEVGKGGFDLELARAGGYLS